MFAMFLFHMNKLSFELHKISVRSFQSTKETYFESCFLKLAFVNFEQNIFKIHVKKCIFSKPVGLALAYNFPKNELCQKIFKNFDYFLGMPTLTNLFRWLLACTRCFEKLLSARLLLVPSAQILTRKESHFLLQYLYCRTVAQKILYNVTENFQGNVYYRSFFSKD